MSTLLVMLDESTAAWLPRLTLVVLLAGHPWDQYRPSGSPAQLAALLASAVTACGLAVPALATTPAYWLVLGVLHFSWVASAYFVADNHYYLAGYWIIAVGLALTVPPEHVSASLRTSAQLLVGACFGLAVIAKLVNGRYRDGSFFVFELVSDPRFLPVAVYGGRLTEELRRRHAEVSAAVAQGVLRNGQAAVPAETLWVAQGLTWWTIAIESVVAVLFLLPGDGLEVGRIVSLVVFAVTTFGFVSVPTFGRLLLLLLLAGVGGVHARAVVFGLAMFLPVLCFLPHLSYRLTRISTRVSRRLAARRVGSLAGGGPAV